VTSCKEIVDLAFDYIQHELDPERTRRLDRHLERCPSCINFIRTYEYVPNLTRELLHREMPASLKESLREYLRQELAEKARES
jgi:anti-sigma factor RsiW